MTIEKLNEILTRCADRDDDFVAELTHETVDVPFDDLGYDSLALFNAVVQIESDLGVSLEYDVVAQAETPGALLRIVNDTLGARV